jgi:hypothetical protein
LRKILSTRKKVIIAGVAAVAVVGTGGAAYAYFTATGTGSGSAAVGSASTWTVSTPTTAGGPLYPGSGTVTLTFTVTNNGGGPAQLTSATNAVVKHDGSDNAMDGATTLSGCNWRWFSTPVTLPANQTVAAGQTAQVAVQVSLGESNSDQTSCAGHTPEVDLAVG